MIRVCSTGPLVKGIDIYHGDLISDVTLLKPAGIQYAFLKAYEASVDPRFATRWASMNAHGIIRGAYDFFHPGNDPVAQADAFLKTVGPLGAGDLPPVLDWETTDGAPVGNDREAGYAWLTHVMSATKRTPMIYCGPYFANDLKLDSRFAQFGLWIAEYGPSCPLVPAPWKNWNFWQSTDSGRVPGISAPCDTDVFNGSLTDLQAFIAASHVS